MENYACGDCVRQCFHWKYRSSRRNKNPSALAVGSVKEGIYIMLSIKNFTKIYKNGKKAVDNLSLEINSGDIYGFIGQNGAGKTTTIKSVVGVLNFDEGDIVIDGYSIKKEPLKAKSVLAYIPDNPNIYDYLTGIQYLNYIADIFNVSENDRNTRIKKYSEIFEMSRSLGNLISSYSHGMKQKLLVISALIHTPKLLILDEPFVGLDPKATFTLKNIMHEMCNDGCAVFFSTHVLDVAQNLCNKIAIIKDGKLIASGETAEVCGKHSLEDVFLEVTENEQ